MENDEPSKEAAIHYSLQPAKAVQSNKFENGIKVISTILTILTLCVGVFSYRATQKWESAKFITQKLESFAADKDVQLAQQVLDYNSGFLHITATDSFFYNDDMLQNALEVDDENNLSFTPHSYALRQIMDNYLSKLSVFNNYYELGLSNNKIIGTYLKYYVQVIGDTTNTRKSADMRCYLWRYIDHYKYTNVQELCNTYGYDINPARCRIVEDI